MILRSHTLIPLEIGGPGIRLVTGPIVLKAHLRGRVLCRQVYSYRLFGACAPGARNVYSGMI